MDHKTFKQDLTYSCKKFQKEGKVLSAFSDNLSVSEEGQFVAEGNDLDPLEMLVLVKGYVPTKTMLTVYHEKWQDPQGQWHECRWKHHENFNLSMVDVLEEQAQIARVDLYAFLDGFDNVEAEGKSEWHAIGVYIREKFTPIGVREKMLCKKDLQYKPDVSAVKTERKFTIYSRKGKTSIMEVEVEIFSRSPNGEYAARILAPESLYSKQEKKLADGTKQITMVPDVWSSHALQDSIEEARIKQERMVREGFQFEIRKGRRTEYTEEEVQAAVDAVEVVML